MKYLVDPEALRQAHQQQFKLDAWIDTSPFETLLGLNIVEAKAGHAVLTLPFTVKLSNGGGVMHGGALTSLADTAVAMAIKSLLPEGTDFVTTQLSVEFLAPVLEGGVTANARVEGTDGRRFSGECDLCGDRGEVYARMTTTFKVLRLR